MPGWVSLLQRRQQVDNKTIRPSSSSLLVCVHYYFWSVTWHVIAIRYRFGWRLIAAREGSLGGNEVICDWLAGGDSLSSLITFILLFASKRKEFNHESWETQRCSLDIRMDHLQWMKQRFDSFDPSVSCCQPLRSSSLFHTRSKLVGNSWPDLLLRPSTPPHRTKLCLTSISWTSVNHHFVQNICRRTKKSLSQM